IAFGFGGHRVLHFAIGIGRFAAAAGAARLFLAHRFGGNVLRGHDADRRFDAGVIGNRVLREDRGGNALGPVFAHEHFAGGFRRRVAVHRLAILAAVAAATTAAATAAAAFAVLAIGLAFAIGADFGVFAFI